MITFWVSSISIQPRYLKTRETWKENPAGEYSPLLAVITSISNVTIRLTDERWQHILAGHPEVEKYVFQILDIVDSPHIVLYCEEDDFFVAGRDVTEEDGSTHVLIVIYKEINRRDGFIISAYFVHSEKMQRRYTDCELVYHG